MAQTVGVSCLIPVDTELINVFLVEIYSFFSRSKPDNSFLIAKDKRKSIRRKFLIIKWLVS